MLTGRAARRTTWRVLDEWIDADTRVRAPQPTPDAPGHGAAQVGQEEGAAAAAAKTTIGSNPSRRYGSASSRTLAQK